MKFPQIVQDSTIESFQHRGFVVTPGVLDADEIARFGEAVDREVAARRKKA